MSPMQLITPNPDIPCQPGMCLQYVRLTFDLPARYGSATEAWDNSTSQHPDYNFPAGCWVAVWFSLEAIPAGHVALLAPDGSVYSSSDNSATPHHHPDLNDLMAYYARYNLPLTYLGWTEDVAGYPVITLGGIAAMGGTITPTEEGFLMALTDAEQAEILAHVRQADTKADVLVQRTGDLAELVENVRKLVYALASLPAATLNQPFTLADGTVTNLAGILAAIHATPVAGSAVASTAVDVPALASSLMFELRTQITK